MKKSISVPEIPQIWWKAIKAVLQHLESAECQIFSHFIIDRLTLAQKFKRSRRKPQKWPYLEVWNAPHIEIEIVVTLMIVPFASQRTGHISTDRVMLVMGPGWWVKGCYVTVSGCFFFFFFLISQDNGPKWMQHMLNIHSDTISHHVNTTAFDLSLKPQTSTNQIIVVSVTFVQQ